MEQNKFSRLENNYYYGISRVFWHIIIALGSLAIITGIAVLIWSQIPASQNKVVKANPPTKKSYPKPVGVSLNELMNTLPKGAELTKVKNDITKIVEVRNITTEIVEEISRDTIGLSRFNTQIGVLKIIIPVSENISLWKGQGKYVYKNGVKGEKMFKKTRNESLREWVFTSKGIEQRFIDNTDRKKLKSYFDKAALLSSYNNLLKNTNVKNRVPLLKDNLIYFYSNKKGLSKSINIIETISNTIKLINSKEQLNAFWTLKQFINNNPKDGIDLQEFQQGILNKFELSQRLNVIKTINKEYIRYYNNKLASIIENTGQFIPMLSSFKGDQQPVALKNFYHLYRNKNGNRNQQIQQIENEFESEKQKNIVQYQKSLAQAKANLILRQQKKSSMKSLSYKSMAYGLGVVLFISLILLVLSMIRNVNRLAEAMLKNIK